MAESQTWRELLGQLLKNAHEKERVAREIGVTTVTLSRWVRHESSPRPYHLQMLLQALPEQRTRLAALLAQDFEAEAWGIDTASKDIEKLSPEFYAQVLDVIAHVPPSLRFWSVCSLVIQHCLTLFDPHKQGMAATIVGFTFPPTLDLPVRSLHVYAGQGTSLWEGDLRQKAVYLLGAESLCGHAVTTARTLVIEDFQQVERMPVSVPVEDVRSAVAAPLLRADRVGGVLNLYSTQPHSFTPAHVAIVEQCAALVALAFESEEFLVPSRINLAWLPEQQRQWFTSF